MNKFPFSLTQSFDFSLVLLTNKIYTSPEETQIPAKFPGLGNKSKTFQDPSRCPGFEGQTSFVTVGEMGMDIPGEAIVKSQSHKVGACVREEAVTGNILEGPECQLKGGSCS